jgi:hypothetical protein
VRRAAEHQYAHAVAMSAGLDPAWGEALASWTALALEGAADDRMLGALGRRIAAAGSGLVVDDVDLASGNAAWFAFLQEAHGPTAVKVVEESGADRPRLDRAAPGDGDTLDQALRDYQLWCCWWAAGRLAPPAFASRFRRRFSRRPRRRSTLSCSRTRSSRWDPH